MATIGKGLDRSRAVVPRTVKSISMHSSLTHTEAFAESSHGERVGSTRRSFGEIEFDPDHGNVLLDGVQVHLTRREFDLAFLLFLHLDRSVSRTLIRDAVWTQKFNTRSRTIDTHVCFVRKKLGLYPDKGYRLTSLYGYGYRLEQTARVDDN